MKVMSPLQHHPDENILDNMLREVAIMIEMQEAGVPGVGRVLGWTSDWVEVTPDGMAGRRQDAILMEDAGR